MSRPDRFFAPCPRGLEPALAEELKSLSAGGITAVDGGVQFTGTYPLCYTINLESRIASRVLWCVGHGPYGGEDDIFRITRELPWSDWFGPQRTIRVNVAAIRSPLTSLNFATLRIKDAVCDVFRDKTGTRPNVDTRFPDVRVHAFLTATELTLYLDTSGDPLFKRGYRSVTGDAPLRENLAAGVLYLSGWQPGIPLLDPMCGSGTFLTEAAMIAAGMAPGARRRFGFEKLRNFDRSAWEALRDAARQREDRDIESSIYGSDRSREALRLARTNLSAIGMERRVSLTQSNVVDMVAPAASGIIVMNPPYGVRIDEQEGLAHFYPQLGDALKKNFAGWTAYILTADMRLPKLMRLAATKRTPLYNGPLDCRLFEYKLVAGSNRKRA